VQEGRAGEGIVLDPEGNEESNYAWGLGVATNNEAEVLILYQGLL